MTILIIDDEQRILAFVARALEGAGYAVACADDGVVGLAEACDGAYDLVVLDLGLPGVDGLDILGELRSVRPELPVLVLSARTDAATKQRASELGAHDYLTKPFALDDLIARVHARLQIAGDQPRSSAARNDAT